MRENAERETHEVGGEVDEVERAPLERELTELLERDDGCREGPRASEADAAEREVGAPNRSVEESPEREREEGVSELVGSLERVDGAHERPEHTEVGESNEREQEGDVERRSETHARSCRVEAERPGVRGASGRRTFTSGSMRG